MKKTMDLTRVLSLILIAVLVIVVFLHLLRLIHDPDFFWHLKTGEWIWQNRALPSEDPFAFTTPRHLSSREHFILTSYWLSQVTYYLLSLAGGMQGIVLLRFVIAGMLIAVMMKRKGGDTLLSLGLMVLFMTCLLEIYPMDRPQVFSFLFFALLLSLLEKQVKGKVKVEAQDKERDKFEAETKVKEEVKDKKKLNLNLNLNLFFLPLLMLIWANTHGGVVLGQATILLFVATEGMKFIHPSLRPMGKQAYFRLVVAGAAGILISLANPNTYHAFLELRAVPAHMAADNIEYLATPEIFKRLNAHSILLYWLLLLLTCMALVVRIKKPDITVIALIAGTGFFSFTQVRYLAFFLIAALPVLGRAFSDRRLLKGGRTFVFLLALFSATYFTWDERLNVRTAGSGTWVDLNAMPVRAADFIVASDLRGNLYNHYNWGGYLIWRLSPERKVFIDGRNLYEQTYSRALSISVAGESWEQLLEVYKVRYIVIPLALPSGRMLPLVNALLGERDWIPVFFSLNSLIFVKDSPENYHVLRTYSIPKDFFVEDLIRECNRMIQANPSNIFPYIAKGDIYLIRFRFEEARQAYEQVLSIAPYNPTARQRLDFIKQTGGMLQGTMR